ncbi:CYCLIC NUCLEOTIDE-GATED CHANNEL 16, cyclic nucleotide-gated channel 16 [Hibiscus trionum]|uniref:CYCLIC NUCLEOTIDE-GATED CHANNEL 16, cyclic nucleotide-gated channel 16 n=1 Tax=Hibiscus trionum TaxID=183268 RepID=A0A9W7H651_HIBTR|nr:CYCLIC NUCLEOTIDE-GATED CHANNEL 16, cyclic nucleotide-gated channel 16 [Hibiscus trionum]
MNNVLQRYASKKFADFPKTFYIRQETPWWNQILDPGSPTLTKWNHVILFTCLIALFLDPLYFYLPVVGGPGCMQIDLGLGIFVTFVRTVADLFFFMHIAIKFRTAFVAPTSRVFGRGELVMDRKAIAIRYLRSSFIIDLAAALPLPQIVIWFIIPGSKSATAAHSNHTLSFIVLLQYIPRFSIMFPINRRIIKSTGVVAKSAWSGAVYNLVQYTLASHILGASWYVLSIQRQYDCWSIECTKEMNNTHSPSCNHYFLDCSTLAKPARKAWLKQTNVVINCDGLNDDNKEFEFGMYSDAFTNNVGSSTFRNKFFYCLWWGLKSLCSYGQSIVTSTLPSETLFCCLICIAGLVFFSLFIGNMQSYLQSTTARLEEWRIRRRDTEEWMRHRQLPLDLQERVRRFVNYQWVATRGVDEEAILKSLPLDLRRQIQRHLCLALVRRVPFFAQMDDQLLDAICERLVCSLNTKDMFLIREGDPVPEMLFIIRGKVESSTTNGGRTGFYNSITLGPGDFCGEELLTWALIPNPESCLNFPLSTRTVKSITEVEAFALRAWELRYVAKQFKRLHSKKLQHAFRYYSHQWRTWGACFIQAAWRRYKRRKLAIELAKQESFCDDSSEGTVAAAEGEDAEAGSSDATHQTQHIGVTLLASKFAKNTRKGAKKVMGMAHARLGDDSMLKMPKMFKPVEPDFFHLD